MANGHILTQRSESYDKLRYETTDTYDKFGFVDRKELSSNYDQIQIVIHTAILLHAIVYMLKILFELSLSISRITNVLELINLSFMFVVVITKYVEIFLKSKLEIDLTSDTFFFDNSVIIQLEKINTLFLTVCCFFFPFRLF